MTVASTTNRVSYAGNGTTTDFAFPHPYRASSDLVVTLRTTATGAEVAQVEGVNYTVSGTPTSDAGGFASATVSFGTAPASGTQVHIDRIVARTQTTDYVAGDGIPPSSIEGSLDKLTQLVQELDSRFERTLLQPRTAANRNLVLPEPTSGTASRVLAVNAGGTAYELRAPDGIPNGDKGDITVSGAGDTWTIDANAVTTAKIADGAVTAGKIGDAELSALAGLTSAANKLPYFTGSGTAALADLTVAGRDLIAGADATAQRGTLGLGTIATQAANNVSITGGSITNITDLAIADGGTGASTAANARTNLGLTAAATNTVEQEYDTVAAVNSATIDSSINHIRTAGYYAAGDGGAALYKRVGSVPSHNGYTTSNSGTVYWELAETVPNVKMFGAKDDVNFNSTTAIQNAIDYVETRNGGVLRLGSGVYRIESTLNMNATVAVDLLGDGADGIHDVAGTAVAATNLVWYGSAGGTVLAVQSPAATGHMQTGPNVEDVRIDCRGVAGVGMLIKSVRGGTFRRIYVIDSTIAAFKLTNYDKNVAGEATDLNSCVFDRLAWRCIDSAAVRGSHGLWLTADSFTGNANVSLNTFEQCSGQNWGGSANAAVNITGITQANPGVVTANSHGLVNGDIVYITGVGGMTQVNDRRFTVAGATTNTFQLSGVNTTSYTAYTSGGTVSKITQVSGHGLFLECGDNNNFYRCAFYRGNSGTGGTFYECVRIEGNQGTDSNNFWNLSAGGANSIQIRGTSSGYNNNNTRNSFWCADNSNGTQYPIADSGCIFTWHSDLNTFEKLLTTNVVIADGATTARTESANVGNGSLRISNASSNHMQLTDGTNTWAVAIVPDFRISRLAGSGSLNLGNGTNAYAAGDVGLGTNSLLSNTRVTVSANNTGDAVNITQNGTGNGLTVNTRVGIGTSGTQVRRLNIDTGAAYDGIRVLTTVNPGGAPVIEATGSRNDGNGTFQARLAASARRADGTAIASGAHLGSLLFGGQHGTGTTYDATSVRYSCSIHGIAEGSFTNVSTMPSALVFRTGSTGEDVYAANLNYGTERLRINSAGYVQVISAPLMPYQAAQTSKGAAATLTGPELVTGILQYTGAADTITLPTGTTIEGALTWNANNVCLDWFVVNTGTGTCTIAANGNTTVGALTVANGASGWFRIRRTAANTFTVYRLN